MDIQIKELFEMVEEKELVLPDFQRDYIWTKQQQKELIMSVLLSLPIGSLLTLDGSKNDFATKVIGMSDKEELPKDKCKYLLDGQQRITSLKYIFSDPFDSKDWQDIIRNTANKLRVRWFLRVNTLENEVDVFGYNNLRFDANSLKKEEPLAFERRLSCEQIGITKFANWYNPGYECLDESEKTEDESQNRRKKMSKISRLAVGSIKEKNKDSEDIKELPNYLIPLYSIYKKDGSKPLYEYVIDRIGDARKIDLKNECGNDKDKLNQYLYDISDDIDIDIEEANYEKIEGAWSKLAERWKVDLQDYIKNVLEQKISNINLPIDEIGRAVLIFERVNRGGTKLDNFDLIVARAARSQELGSLTARIKSYLNTQIDIPDSLTKHIYGSNIEKMNLIDMGLIKDNEIISIVKNQYLNLLSMISNISYGAVDCIDIDLMKRDKILRLTAEQINENTETTIKGLKRAAAFLSVRCGIIKLNNLSYDLTILPLAYLLVDDDVWNNTSKLDKLEYWYWASILSGRYMDNQNQRCIDDVKNVYRWIIKDEDKYSDLRSSVLNVAGYCNEDILTGKDKDNEINSNVKKTILQYILSKQPKDFLEDRELKTWELAKENINVDDHHIIPLKQEAKIGESTSVLRNKGNHILNSTMNRVYILAKSNNTIRDYSPKHYLEDIKEEALRNNLIDKELFKNIYVDDETSQEVKYSEIFKDRYKKLIESLRNELDKLYKS